MKGTRVLLLVVSLTVLAQLSSCVPRGCQTSYSGYERWCALHQVNAANATDEDVTSSFWCTVRCMEAAFHDNDFDKAKHCYAYHIPMLRDHYLKPRLGNIDECVAMSDRSNCTASLMYRFFGSLEDLDWRVGPLFIEAWLTHPDLPLKEFSCVNYPYYYTIRLLKRLAEESATDASTTDPIGAIEGTNPIDHWKGEIQRYCRDNGQKAEAIHFCVSSYFYDFAINIHQAAKAEHRDSRMIDMNDNVFKLSLNMLMFKVGETFSKSAEDIKEEYLNAFKNYVDYFLGKVESNARKSEYRSDELFSDISLVKEFCSGNVQVVSLTRPNNIKAAPEYMKKIGCLTQEMMGQLLAFSHKRGKVAVMTINPSVDYKTYLQELREERILQLLLSLTVDFQRQQDQSEAQLNNKFNQLKQYFDKINSFNKQIAEADIAYVKGVLKFYKDKMTKFSTELGENVQKILNEAYKVAVIHVGYDFAKLTMTVAQAMNPMDLLINGGSFTDIMEATSDLAQSTLELTRVNKDFKNWGDLFTNVTEISKGYRKNAEMMTAMTKIVEDMVKGEDEPSAPDIEDNKNIYLKEYNNYDPQVKRIELEVVEQGMDEVIESTCETLSNVKGPSGIVAEQAIMDNICPKARESATKMMTTLLEIYDLQFELIDCITEYMRASTAMDAAKSMGTVSVESALSTTSTQEQRTEYRAGILVAHLTYQNQRAASVEKYCDYLRYQEGGTIPHVCKMKPISITALLSYIPKSCTLQDGYFDVPTTTKLPPPKGSIYLPDLYAGEEVTLQIPDYKWLIKNRWIEKNQEHKSIKVQSFQPILPTVSRKKHQVIVRVTAAGNNTLKPNGIRYNLIQPMTETAIYDEGQFYTPCAGKEYDNPYTLCPYDQLPRICMNTNQGGNLERGGVHPSIFSSWRFKTNTYKREAPLLPDPKTPLFLKVKATLCVNFKISNLFKRGRMYRPMTCCGSNQYWSVESRTCTGCPAGSAPKLKGYYCQ